MRALIYGYRADEEAAFDEFTARLGIEPVYLRENLNRETAARAQGIEAVAVNAMSLLDRENLEQLARQGVRYIATRSIGFDNLDVEACRALGLKFANAPYSPHSVADYTVMLMLMVTRKLKTIQRRALAQDYGFEGFQGRELHNLTVGVVGTGRIGRTVLGDLAGFGPHCIAYDLYPRDALLGQVEYVGLDELFARADIITLHAPLQASSRHMVNAESIAKMKDGVVLVNTARGELVDTAALIDALESGKVGGAALDVLEGEQAYTFADRRSGRIVSRERAILEAMPNVLLTGHYAFYTDQAVSDEVRIALEALKQFTETGRADSQII